MLFLQKDHLKLVESKLEKTSMLRDLYSTFFFNWEFRSWTWKNCFDFWVFFSLSEVTQSCPTLCDPMDCNLTRFLCPWDFPGKTTRVGCHCLLQEIFPTQGLNPGLPRCRQTLYCLSHQGANILVTFCIICSFSSGSKLCYHSSDWSRGGIHSPPEPHAVDDSGCISCSTYPRDPASPH